MKKENRAYIIKVDGTIKYLNHRPTLVEAREIVGGYIEFYPKMYMKSKQMTMICDEEGLLKQKNVNLYAHNLTYHPVVVTPVPVGDVLILEGWKTVGG